MRARYVMAAAAALALGAAVACGLDVTGTFEPAEGGVPDGVAPPPPDGIDASQSCDGSACGLVVPTGWSVVTFGPRTTACSAGAASNDVIEGPAADAGACTCAACTVTTPPSCATGSINVKFDAVGIGLCPIDAPFNWDANNGACKQTDNTTKNTGAQTSIDGPTPSGGACTPGASSPVRAAVAAGDSRVCVPNACAGACGVPGTRACLLSAGDQPCPSGAMEKHLVGTDFALTCGACGCKATAQHCTGAVTLYDDNACAMPKHTLPSRACTTTNGDNAGSYKWDGGPTGVACNGDVPDASIALVGTTTICCP